MTALPRSCRSRSMIVAALPVLLLSGCSGVLDPAGPIGKSERIILFDTLAIMLAIVVPTILAALAVAWWFRASNTRARYRPDWSYSGMLELIVWSIPLMVVLFLGGIGWISSHDLDPYKPISSPAKALEVEVVSLDWKWLFIYPDQGIASVNRLVIPAGVPVHFRLTSATVMNSFFVPRLGSQIYTMAGMTTQLSLEADKPGTYPGISAQFSGAGFSGMTFAVVAIPPSQFVGWIAATHSSGTQLDAAAYARLAKPSQDNPAASYSQVSPHLFENIVGQSAPGSMTARSVPPTAGPSQGGN
jgi:cytochrome o ubiquinol oxidase subunit II